MAEASPTRSEDHAAALCRELEARWHREIPISAAMGISVSQFHGGRLAVTAELAANVNVHGTAFAGSLFSLASLTGWGLVYLQMLDRNLTGSIVFVQGQIRCLKPAEADVTARAGWSESAAAALDALADSGRARFHLNVELDAGNGIAATFSGEYGVRC